MIKVLELKTRAKEAQVTPWFPCSAWEPKPSTLRVPIDPNCQRYRARHGDEDGAPFSL